MNRLLAHIHDYLAARECVFPDIDLLQPADPFLDTTGEDLRRRIFMTQENSGKSLCLRPEFTIPVCLHHLETSGAHARYAYGGKVFRQRSTGPTEFVQAGFEDLGNLDRSRADADCIRIALEMLNRIKGTRMQTVIGDQSVFVSLLDALEIPLAWRKKLLRAFGDQKFLTAQLDRIDGNGLPNKTLPRNLLAALQSEDSEGVLQFVTGRMEQDGLPLTGGRTPQAISDRLIEHYQLRSTELPLKARYALDAFLKIETPLGSAVTELRKFENSHGVSLPHAADKIASLKEGLDEHTRQCTYRARFGRRLDYYTGLVFEIYPEGSGLPVVGGGRYDMLMTLLGAAREVPAVGFAVWVDRLEGR